MNVNPAEKAHRRKARPRARPVRAAVEELAGFDLLPRGTDCRSGLELAAARCSWWSAAGVPAFLQRLADTSPQRLADITARQAATSAAQSGARWQAGPVMCAARSAEKVLALGFATPVDFRDGRTGVHLAFVLDEEVEGRGVAALLSCLAFSECMTRLEARPADFPGRRDYVGVQCRENNAAAIRLALALGLQPDEALRFEADNVEQRDGEPVVYLGFSASFGEFEASAARRIAARCGN